MAILHNPAQRLLRNMLPVVCLAILPAHIQAGDWPQILGPSRNGVAVGERIASSWPGRGPKTLWQREVGSGFAGVAVSKGTAILFHRVGDQALSENEGFLEYEFLTDLSPLVARDR